MSPPSLALRPPTEKELIDRCLNGDESAWTELVNRFDPLLFSYVIGFTRNPADAQDVVQETWFKIYRGLATYKGNAQFKTWSLQIARNLSLNWLRSSKRHGGGRTNPIDELHPETAEPVMQLIASTHGPDDSLLLQEDYQRMQNAIESLPEEDRELIHMKLVLELTEVEIAAILDRTVGTISSRLCRAKARAREIFSAGMPVPRCQRF